MWPFVSLTAVLHASRNTHSRPVPLSILPTKAPAELKTSIAGFSSSLTSAPGSATYTSPLAGSTFTPQRSRLSGSPGLSVSCEVYSCTSAACRGPGQSPSAPTKAPSTPHRPTRAALRRRFSPACSPQRCRSTPRKVRVSFSYPRFRLFDALKTRDYSCRAPRVKRGSLGGHAVLMKAAPGLDECLAESFKKPAWGRNFRPHAMLLPSYLR